MFALLIILRHFTYGQFYYHLLAAGSHWQSLGTVCKCREVSDQLQQPLTSGSLCNDKFLSSISLAAFILESFGCSSAAVWLQSNWKFQVKQEGGVEILV